VVVITLFVKYCFILYKIEKIYTLKQLRYFVAVAERQNVSTAAQDLHISQPAVSAAIGNLEDQFGVQLLLRHHAKGVSLTSAGRSFLSEAQRLLAHADELSMHARSLGGALEGPLTVGCFVTLSPFYLPQILRGFSETHPRVEVHIVEGAMDTLRDSLISGASEVALMYDLGLSDAIETEHLCHIAPYVLMSKSHPMSSSEAVSLKKIAGEPMVLLDLPHSRDYFHSLFLRLGIEPNVRFRTMSFELVRGIVANSNAYSILNLRPAKDVTYGGEKLVGVPIEEQVKPLPIALAWVRGARLTRRSQAFAEHCRDYFSKAAPS